MLRLLRRLSGGASAGRSAALGILLALAALRILDPLPLEELRLRVFDLFQRLAVQANANHQVAIVDIDDASLKAIGQWPWPRTRLAALVEGIGRAGAIAIAFDIVFPEPDRMSPGGIADELAGLDADTKKRLKSLPSNDEIFAQSFSKVRTVLAQSGYNGETKIIQNDGKSAETPLGVLGPDPSKFVLSFPALLRNVPELERAAAGRGLFTIRPDEDGIVRRVPVIMRAEGQFRPALTIELLRVATGSDALLLKSDDAGMRSIVVGGVAIPTDSNGRVWIRYGPHDPSRFVAAHEVLEGNPAALAKLRGKLALVGTSAIGLLDLKTTPVEAAMPGVEVHAQLLDGILSSALLTRPNYAIGAELAAAIATGLAIILLVPILGARSVFLVGAALAAIIAGGAFYLYRHEGLLIDVTYPLISGFAVFWTLVFFNYFREESRRQQIRGAFSQYLSPAFVNELALNPDKLKLGGETKEVSILFSDVRDFTSIAEVFKSNPQGLTQLMNSLLSPLSAAVVDNAGTIDKYIGDSIMAFWNAPLDDAEHAIHACNAAMKMIGALHELNAKLQAEAQQRGETAINLEIGIGVNTGQGVVGNMGSDVRFDYTVLGDSVNLASRLEGQTKTYGYPIIIGSQTNAQVEQHLATLPLDLIQVKGKKQPERIFALLGDKEMLLRPEFQSLRSEHSLMLTAYLQREWDDALSSLSALKAKSASYGLAAVYDLYEGRIGDFKETPPPSEWDGVYKAKMK